jgi:hypothetical protein
VKFLVGADVAECFAAKHVDASGNLHACQFGIARSRREDQ